MTALRKSDGDGNVAQWQSYLPTSLPCIRNIARRPYNSGAVALQLVGEVKCDNGLVLNHQDSTLG
jgi:hypothetical protein